MLLVKYFNNTDGYGTYRISDQRINNRKIDTVSCNKSRIYQGDDPIVIRFSLPFVLRGAVVLVNLYYLL